jgi:hypothetical protein
MSRVCAALICCLGERQIGRFARLERLVAVKSHQTSAEHDEPAPGRVS